MLAGQASGKVGCCWSGEQRACGEVQQAEVGIHYGLLPDGQQANLGHQSLRAGGLDLGQQEQNLRVQ